jgi:hypothetical protein
LGESEVGGKRDRERQLGQSDQTTHTYTRTYIHTQEERDREKETERDRERQRAELTVDGRLAHVLDLCVGDGVHAAVILALHVQGLALDRHDDRGHGIVLDSGQPYLLALSCATVVSEHTVAKRKSRESAREEERERWKERERERERETHTHKHTLIDRQTDRQTDMT